MGLATGAFHWASSPWFVAAKQAAAEWLIDRGIMWPLTAQAPWWVLTSYPEQNDVMTPLDGAVLFAYLLAATLAIGGTVLLFRGGGQPRTERAEREGASRRAVSSSCAKPYPRRRVRRVPGPFRADHHHAACGRDHPALPCDGAVPADGRGMPVVHCPCMAHLRPLCASWSARFAASGSHGGGCPRRGSPPGPLLSDPARLRLAGRCPSAKRAQKRCSPRLPWT